MSTNRRRHHYEGCCVSWKARRISMRATASSVRFVSERVTTLAAALAKIKAPLHNLFHVQSPITCPDKREKKKKKKMDYDSPRPAGGRNASVPRPGGQGARRCLEGMSPASHVSHLWKTLQSCRVTTCSCIFNLKKKKKRKPESFFFASFLNQ